MSTSNSQRFHTMCEAYDKMIQKLFPNYNFLQNELFNIVTFNENDHINVIDLGGGSGIMLEKILIKYPNCKCYWIDSSKEFKKIAENRLRKYSDRVKYIISDFENNWQEYIDKEMDLVVSMSAIHHLETDEKNNLYEKIYNILKKDGWFLNIDEMKTLYFESYRNSLLFWDNYVSKNKNHISQNNMKYYDTFYYYFEKWKNRNISNIQKPKEKGDDIHENFVQQLNSLNNIGFNGVDVFIKYHLWCIVGGYK